MKILVTGKNGQLGTELFDLKNSDSNWIFLDKYELDITNQINLNKYLSIYDIDYIINCAAYTNVDKAEVNKEECFAVNTFGVQNIINACELYDIRLIHISTDFVFDGSKKSHYNEDDITCPLNIYGKSKLQGENIIKKSRVESIILRTSWVFSNYGKNFVKSIIRLSKSNRELTVISDQYGSPTYAKHLAEAIVTIINNKQYKWKVGDVFNISGSGECSWSDFSKKIVDYLNLSLVIKDISSDEYQSQTKRPSYSVLNNSKLKETFGIKLCNWSQSLFEMLNNSN